MVRSAGGYAESASVTILLPGTDAHSSVRARHSSNEPSSERGGGAQHGTRGFLSGDARERVEWLVQHRLRAAEFGKQCTQRDGRQTARIRQPQPG